MEGHQRWVWDCAFSADSAYLVTGRSSSPSLALKNKVPLFVEKYFHALVGIDILLRGVLWRIVLRMFLILVVRILFEDIRDFMGFTDCLASSDHIARLWELSSGKTIRQYSGHHKGAVALALNDCLT